MSVLAARGLRKRYGRRVAVDGVSLTVERGEVYGFLGPNGAGKSTTLRMLVGLVRPTAGEVHLFGRPFERVALARVGALIEAPSFYPYLSGRANLRMLADLTGPCPRQRIDEVLERVGLADRADDRAEIYSHGMKQRLAIAAALVPGPELVILDEPTNGLDPMGIRDMRGLITSLAHDDGIAVVLSSHLLAEVEQVAGRGCILARGRAVWEGEVPELRRSRRRLRLWASPAARAAEVLAAAGVEATEVGPGAPAGDGRFHIAGSADAAALVERLVVAGVRVHEIVEATPTLEEIFVELVAAAPEAA